MTIHGKRLTILQTTLLVALRQTEEQVVPKWCLQKELVTLVVIFGIPIDRTACDSDNIG